ncbi:BREX-1 system adenine-specific DNA-methyltransferase PglX [Mesobacillus foraminis]|uniref:BREX-1 system adenine-specific DNA-methyltransferase PglX n=1 Tax=Mesobacillus foraminis TaxID=279826 RepID=UPI000EF4AB26|nr:BREX-1 system adenine-specific DNA-methyltransferase PglX [Mesobacillus foraminis]
MNKSALKTFATSARKELLKKIEAKAMKIGITEDNIKKADIESSDAIFIDGRQLSKVEKTQRDKLIARINQIGFKQVMEEVAYTWFNRFTALRFMEVNDYLPTGVRVLSSSNSNSADPDMLNEPLELNLEVKLDKKHIYNLKLNNETEELFKYLIIKHCNDLNRLLPFMFETIDDYKQILFPEGLLSKDSFIRQMTDIAFIPEDNWQKVEIIGWLYQYYIAEEKSRVFNAKKKYKKEEIPYATQLFTPDWIVRYMVQNSVGRYWIESHPEHRDLIENWEFYLENPNPEPDFEKKLAPYINKDLKVEEIKCFDPAMGSGHILVYLFDVLYEIYSKCGYMEREIPRLIIENNLYGLDIDDRAYQLACFSIVMKAMEYNNRFFRSIEREELKINMVSIQESNILSDEDISYIAGESKGEKFNKTKEFINQFFNAKSLGSLIKVNEINKNYFTDRLQSIKATPANDLFEEETRSRVLNTLPNLLRQFEIMINKYDILITNPPYMGSKYMNNDLSKYLKEKYPDSKTDTFASFMEINSYLKPTALMAMVNQHSWMFLSSYENLRIKVIRNRTIDSMLHLGPRAFEDIGGEVVQTTAFVLRNYLVKDHKGDYVRLVEYKNSKEKEKKTLEVISSKNSTLRYFVLSEEHVKIPGSPIAYWVSDSVKKAFELGKPMGEVAEPRQGMATADNEKFLRLWFEVDINRVGFGFTNSEQAEKSGLKWFPYNKGGDFRKWYGNNQYIVNWENNGAEIKNFKDSNGKLKSRPQNTQYFFKKGMTWNLIGTSNFGVRCFEEGMLFDIGSHSLFSDEKLFLFFAGLLNAKVTKELLKILNPTMNFSSGVIANIPVLLNIEEFKIEEIKNLVFKNILISKEEWDSYEESWDFKKHPLLELDNKTTIEDAFNNLVVNSNNQFYKIKEHEEEINRIFIEIYGLQGEMTPEVDESSVTIRKADKERYMRSFISYAVGCMFGRYSLDKEGLVYTGGEFDIDRYSTFKADTDNILPILPGAYFEDDIVTKFIEFVKVTFGEETLGENLDFIAESIGKKKSETAKETIRRYFLNDFFKDHVQTYKKRPIYWLFTSGKQKAFTCLIYMHRYDKSTLSRIRTDYLHEYQIRLDAEKKDLLSIIEGDYTTNEISNAKKQLKALDKKIEELKEYDELLHHMADRQIEINLDDGVAYNYDLFKGLVAKI